MTGKTAEDQETAREFIFLLIPRFSMMSFTSAIEPLRAANILSDREIYRWTLCSPDGEPVEAANGVRMMVDSPLSEIGAHATLVVCSGVDAQHFKHAATMAAIRRHAVQGGQTGAISDGSYILARAGLLEGRQCVIHWSCLDAFQEHFPDIKSAADIYHIDGQIFTSSGGTAPMDLMLELIAKDRGVELAGEIAAYFLHDHIRREGELKSGTLAEVNSRRNRHLNRAIILMRENLEDPLPINEIATRIGISERHMMRVFKQHVGSSASKFYLELRLNRARLLLQQTSMPISEVAMACGFVSFSHFSKCYRECFGKKPKQERPTAALPEAFR